MPPIRNSISASDRPLLQSDQALATAPPVSGKTRTSWVWKYGDELPNQKRPGRWFWRCSLCPNRSTAQKFDDRGTGHIADHLRDSHRISEHGALPSNQNTLRRPTVDPHVLRKLIVEWVIDRRHSFNEIEAESFRKIISYIDIAAESKLPKSGKTLRSDILHYFHEAKSTVIEQLSMARSKIHLGFDLWTAPNYTPMLAITGHWTGHDYTAKTSLLAIREISGAHAGENIGHTVYEMMKEFGICAKIGYFMGDNASNNDTTIQSINRRLQEDGFDGFEWEERRLRCWGHIMNLVVKALLFGPNVSKLEKERRDGEDITTYERQQTLRWRALGAIGKSHNIVKFIRVSPQRRAAFLSQELQKDSAFMLRADNDTRWNSTWNMLESLLRQRERVDAYISMMSELVNDRLSDQDWADLQEVYELLKPFKMLTMIGQEKNSLHGSIGSILWGMDMLLTVLEEARKKSSDIRSPDSPFQLALDHAWGILNKYYSETDKCRMYIVSLVLDPRMKYDYFERNWKKKWIRDMKEKMRSVWEECDGQPSSAITTSPTVIADTSPFDVNKWRFGTAKPVRDELTRYLDAPLLVLDSPEANESFDAMKWWTGNMQEFPVLAQLAFETFSIPAMSVEPERVFSG